MADPNLGQITATVWNNKLNKKPANNIFTSEALFYLLGEEGFKQKASGGANFEYTVEYAKNTTFKSYGELDLLDVTRVDVFDAATFSPKIAAGTVVISELERLRALGESAKIDLIAEKLNNGERSHIADLNIQCFSDGTGNNSRDFGGLQLLIASAPTTQGAVGGISRTTFPFWRNRQNSGAKTTSSFDNLRAQMRTTFNQCALGGLKELPTCWITDQTSFQGYESLLIANERYDTKDKSTKGDAAFENDVLMFKGKPGSYDEDCPAGNLYFLNNAHLKITYYEGGWMKMYPEVDPSNQLANVHKVATFGNMTVDDSRHLGVVTAIS